MRACVQMSLVATYRHLVVQAYRRELDLYLKQSITDHAYVKDPVTGLKVHVADLIETRLDVTSQRVTQITELHMAASAADGWSSVQTLSTLCSRLVEVSGLASGQ